MRTNTNLRYVLDERNEELDVGEQVQVEEYADGGQFDQNEEDDRDRPEDDQQDGGWSTDRLVLAFVDAEALDQRDDADEERVHCEHHVVRFDRYQTERILFQVLPPDAAIVAHRNVEDRVEEEAGHVEGDKVEVQADHRLTANVQDDLRVEAYGPGEL